MPEKNVQLPPANPKYVYMIRDGITPRVLEQCRTAEERNRIADLTGWDRADLRKMQIDFGINTQGDLDGREVMR